MYTLEVTPEQGERLTLAANRGSLQFALRGTMDLDTVLTKGVTVPELLTSLVLADPKPVAVPPVVQPAVAKSEPARKRTTKKHTPPPKKTKITVDVIKGIEQSQKEFTL